MDRQRAAIEAGNPSWADLPSTRAEAIASDAAKYFTGKPCRHGHVEPRYTRGNCEGCLRDYDKDYLEAKRKGTTASDLRRARRAKSNKPLPTYSAGELRAMPTTKKEAREIGARLYFTGEPCKYGHVVPRFTSGGNCCSCNVIEGRKRIATAEGREANRAYLQGYFAKAEVKEAHRLYMRSNAAKRNAQKKRASPPWLTTDHWAQIKAFYDEAERLTRETGEKHEVDHIVPLVNPLVCGLHIPLNLRVTTKFENQSKSNAFDGGW